jgi:hypothetical protein
VTLPGSRSPLGRPQRNRPRWPPAPPRRSTGARPGGTA